MKNLILLKYQVMNTLEFNTRKNKLKKIVLILFIFSVLSWYFLITIPLLKNLNLEKYILAFNLAKIWGFLVLISFLRGNLYIFNKDFEKLKALPVNKFDIFSSKIMDFYILLLFITLSSLLPLIFFLDMFFLSKIFVIFSLFFIPLLPLVIGSSVLILFTLFLKKIKLNKNIVTTMLMFILLLFIVLISSKENKGMAIEKYAVKIFPLAKIYIIETYMLLKIFMFSILSIIIFIFYLTFLNKNYEHIYYLINAENVENIREVKKENSKFMALYKQEISKIFNIKGYIVNCGFSIILLIALSIIGIFFGVDKVLSILDLENVSSIVVNRYVYIPTLLFSMCCTTVSSISLEGNKMWILQTSPLKTKDIINSRILANMSLHLFGFLFYFVFCLVRIKFSVELIVVPLIYSFFVASLGIYLNINYPKFNWTKEISVIKQSGIAFSQSIISSLVSVISLLLANILYVKWILPLLVLIFSVLLYIDAIRVKYIGERS